MKYTFINFKKQLVLLFMVAGTLVFGQAPALEMATGASNPTGNGAATTPFTTTTAINFQNNTNNPTGNTLAAHTPTLTATYTIQDVETGYAGAFSIGRNGTTAAPIFDLMNSQGSPANANFTSAGVSANTGIDIGFNRAVRMFISTTPLRTNNVGTSGTQRIANLVIAFNRPVNNPVIHIGALGGRSTSLGFSGRLEITGSNVPVTSLSLTRLSGNNATGFQVAGRTIFNGADSMNGTGDNSGSGSVRINGTGITSLTFTVSITGDGDSAAVSSWDAGGTNTTGEAFLIGFSTLESDIQLTKTMSNQAAPVGGTVSFLVTATNNGPSNNTNIVIADALPSGYTIGTPINASAGSYSSGVWTIPSLNAGASATLTIPATVNASGNYTNVATITSAALTDQNSANNTASVSRFADSDSDGVFDYLDLDSDNDGILDTVECPPTNIVTNGTFTTNLNGWTVGPNWTHSATVGAYNEGDFMTNGSVLSQAVTGLNGVKGGIVALNLQIGAQDAGQTANNTASLEIILNNTVYATLTNGTLRNNSNVTIAMANGATSTFTVFGTNGVIGYNQQTFTIYIPYNGPNAATLSFRMVSGGDDWSVDNVSINAFPCDTDGDTIPNYLDLDSDGDGCFDVLEGGANFQSGATYITGNRLNTTVNASGVPAVPTGTTPAITGYTQAAGQTVGSAQNSTIFDAQCATAIGCTNAIYLSQSSTLYGVNTTTNPFTYPPVGVNQAGDYNAIAISPIDGRMYGIPAISSNNVIVINANGTSINLGPILNLPAGNYNAGEIDNLGNYYVKAAGVNNQMFRINLTTLTATTITLSANISISDLAFRTTNGLFYAVGNDTGRLISISPTGTVIGIGSSPGAIVFGAMFASSTGEIYGSDNAGGFYQFNIANGQRVLISDSPPSDANDGAHCVTTPIAFSADLSVTKSNNAATYLQGTSTIYTIVVRNNGPFGVLNATVSDPVPTGIPAANVSYTAVASSGSTTAVSGTQIGTINDLVSLPVNGTVTYTVTVSIPASFTGNLVNTVTVTSPANSTDPNTANNTATDTDTPYCTGIDSDGDGIPDICDLDDDNDGILDAVESPNCFFAGYEVRSMISSITSQFPSTDNFNLLYNYIVESTEATAFNFIPNVTAANNPAGSNLFTIELTRPVALGSIILTDNISNTTAARARLFGSNDNINFVQLTSAESDISAGAGTTFTINQNAGKYRFYKIQTTVAGAIANTDFIGEIIPVVATNYIASEYPKGTCFDDLDGDGTVNHLDLDSDGDGCFDVIEGGANFAIGASYITANRLNTAVNTSGVPGVPASTTGYTQTGGQTIGQSNSADRNDCLDSDGDTVPDWIDLDDDNDGILDLTECPNNYIVRPVVTSSITTVSTITNGNIQKIADYEGAGVGTGSAPPGETTHWFTNAVNNLPVVVNMNLQAASTIDHIKIFSAWGQGEQMKDFKVELYNVSNVLLGTENLTAPDSYTAQVILRFSKEYLNVTRVRFTILTDQGLSIVNPKRVSLMELAFLDLQICDTDGDGIPNRLDLDADGDGCPDVIEGAANFQNGASYITGNRLNTAVNASGVPAAPTGTTPPITGYTQAAGQEIGNSQDGTRNDCLDSDGDGIADWQDVDDDNDGILDTNECSLDFSTYVVNNFTSVVPAISGSTADNTKFLQLRPSDFGLTTAGATNQNASRDYSSFFGLPVGSIIVTVENAHVHPNATSNPASNAFYVSARNGVGNTKITVSGTLGAYMAIEHGQEYYGIQERGIQFLDGSNITAGNLIDISGPLQPNFTKGNTGNYYYTRHNATASPMLTDFTIGSINSQINPKRVSVSTNNIVSNQYSTYFIRIFPECDSDKDGVPNRLDLDSDGDSCPDALEGTANFLSSQLVTAGGTVNGGSTTIDQNLCAGSGCVSTGGANIGLPQFTTPPTGYTNATGQNAGDAYNAAVNGCFCTQLPTLGTPDGFTMVGVSTHETQISGWPENVGNGFIALDSQTKGMVITRVQHVGGTSGFPLPTDSVADPFAGMLVYDIDDSCVKLFNGIVWNCIQRTCNTPTN